MKKDQDLTVSLEALGLSRYEAQAYFTLITKGTISASELSYYSKIPRTKVYPTLLKLEKKKLAIVSKSKPIMCTAIAPEDAFDEIIHDQINKVNGMNSLVTKLKRVSEKSKKARGTEEKRYFYLSTNNVLNQLKSMIGGAKSSIHVMADSWGLNIFAQCKDELVHALRKNVDVNIIIPSSLIASEHISTIPSDIKIRISETVQNCIMCDHTEILMIDSSNGKAVIFTSSEILQNNCANMFTSVWKEASKIGNIHEMTKNNVQQTFRIIDIIRENGLGFALNASLRSKEMNIDLLKLLEKNGINLEGLEMEDFIKIIDNGLQITCDGHLNNISNENHIVIESKLNSGNSLPWALLLDGFLNFKGRKTKMVYQNNSRNGEKVHIKITNS